jgi:hypothetical protein
MPAVGQVGKLAKGIMGHREGETSEGKKIGYN